MGDSGRQAARGAATDCFAYKVTKGGKAECAALKELCCAAGDGRCKFYAHRDRRAPFQEGTYRPSAG
jgi:hypothetical protein